MNKTKSTGPKIDPWGTPCFTVSCSDLTFPKVINCFLSDRYDLNQVTEEGRTPDKDKFFRRSSWSITSKALRKSMNTKPVNSSLSMFVNIWSVSLIRAVSVESRHRNGPILKTLWQTWRKSMSNFQTRNITFKLFLPRLPGKKKLSINEHLIRKNKMSANEIFMFLINKSL